MKRLLLSVLVGLVLLASHEAYGFEILNRNVLVVTGSEAEAISVVADRIQQDDVEGFAFEYTNHLTGTLVQIWFPDPGYRVLSQLSALGSTPNVTYKLISNMDMKIIQGSVSRIEPAD